MVVAVALFAAAVAWAGRHRYVGTVKVMSGSTNGTMEFITKTSGGHLVVARFRFDYVPTHCRTGPRLQFFHFNSATFRVKNRRFHGHTRFGNPSTVVVAGRFNKKLTNATGALSLIGAIGPHTGCHTGTLRWSAVQGA